MINPVRKISSKVLAEVISARYEELFSLVYHELIHSGFNQRIAAGIVLTGGGSNIGGCIELAEGCFDMPIRKACAQNVYGISDATTDPSFATGVGLLKYGFNRLYENSYHVPTLSGHPKTLFLRMREWFRGQF